MIEFLTSRSRRLNSLRCQRSRYWLDEAGFIPGVSAGGFSPSALAIPLVTGGSVHVGLRSLMLRAQACPMYPGSTPLVDTSWIDEAVAAARKHYQDQCAGRNFDLDQLESQSFVYNEQLALTEALVRLAGLRVVPKILETYEVLEVERMDVAPLISQDSTTTGRGYCERCGLHRTVHDEQGTHTFIEHTFIEAQPDWRVLWRSIPDALLRSRTDGDLYILSWKTTAEYDQRRDQDARVDLQGLSEPWALESRLISWKRQLDEKKITEVIPEWFSQHNFDGRSPYIRGVQMVYLVKGARRKMSKDALIAGGLTADQIAAGGSMYKTASPLIYGYAQMDKSGGLMPGALAWSSDWRCSAPHPMRKSQWYPSGECPGDGRNHKRGDDWKSFPVWESMGISPWMDALSAGSITPEAGDPLDQQWAMPVPHFRTRSAVESWHRQTVSAEEQLARDLGLIRQYETEVREATGTEYEQDAREAFHAKLDQLFPQSTERCGDWFHRLCPAWNLCHGPAHIAADPVGSGLYQIKQQYVPVEVENG